MQNVRAPLALKIAKWTPGLAGHTRGLTGAVSAGLVEEGPGSRWLLSFDVPAMSLVDARAVRAWLHSLRGRAGTCLVRIPSQMRDVNEALYDDDGTTALYDDDAVELLYDDDAAPADGTGVTTAATTAGATSVAITNATTGALVAGNYAYVGDPGGGTGQLVRIHTVASTTITFRPALRVAYVAGTRVAFGRVFARWRLAGETPAVPMVNSRSQPFRIELEEAY